MTALPHEPAGEGDRPRATEELAGLLAMLDDLGKAAPAFQELLARARTSRAQGLENARALGRARKVSVSLPEELTAAVQQRVGRGEFSQYVTAAVAQQLELDLLADLAALLQEEYGPVPEEFLAEAGAAWPDAE